MHDFLARSRLHRLGDFRLTLAAVPVCDGTEAGQRAAALLEFTDERLPICLPGPVFETLHFGGQSSRNHGFAAQRKQLEENDRHRDQRANGEKNHEEPAIFEELPDLLEARALRGGGEKRWDRHESRSEDQKLKR